MPTLSLTRRVTFRASHRYHRAEWTDARNAEAFGEGPLRASHAHDYWCDVTVSGPVDTGTGMIVDLRVLDAALQDDVVGRFDGRNLNADVAEFAAGAVMPSTENLAAEIAMIVQASLRRRGVRAHVAEVTVAEDASLRATWRADPP